MSDPTPRWQSNAVLSSLLCWFVPHQWSRRSSETKFFAFNDLNAMTGSWFRARFTWHECLRCGLKKPGESQYVPAWLCDRTG